MNSNTARMWRSVLTVVSCALLFVAVHASETVQSGISEIIVEVPRSAGVSTLKLETTVYKPAGDGPFPLIAFNHGKARGKAAFQARACYSEQIAALVARDYVVAISMRQGLVKSGDAYISSGCNVEANGIIQAEDVVAMLDYMAAQPYVDRNRIVAMDQSHGGLATLAFGTIAYPGMHGLVNFASGLRNDTCADWEGNLVHVFEMYGHQSRYPSFWLYGDSDSYWPGPTPDRMFMAYTSVGEKGRLVNFGTFKSGSHGMFASHAGLGIWLPQIDALLRELGLPVGPVQAVAPSSNAEVPGADDPKSDTSKGPE